MGLTSAQYNFEKDELVHLWEVEDFYVNSVLTVQVGQEAVFIRDGVALGEPFVEGRYVLNTSLLPEIMHGDYSLYGDNTFHAKLYFINKDRDLSLNWGTNTPFTIKDSVTPLAFKAGARGSYSLGISDSNLLITKTIGQMGTRSGYTSFTKFQLQDFIKDKLQELVISTMAATIRELKIDLYGIEGYYNEISEKVRRKIDEEGIFEAYGFTLKNFSIKAIQISDEDYEKLQKFTNEAAQRQQDIALDRMYGKTYETETQRKVLEGAVQNEATGQAMNLGLGLAYATTIGSSIGGMMGNMKDRANAQNEVAPQGQNVSPGGICPNCSSMVPQNSLFCPHCGTRMKLQTNNVCAKCGNEVPVGSKFCPSCGAPFVPKQQEIFCTNCGAKNEPNAKFCSTCGSKIGG